MPPGYHSVCPLDQVGPLEVLLEAIYDLVDEALLMIVNAYRKVF